MKVKAWAPVNLALIKYWGKENEDLRIPINSSLSVCLNKTGTQTETEFIKGLKKDEVMIDKKKVEGRKAERVVEHLDRIRQMAGIDLKAKVVSQNNFPMGVGLSSSASGMAALSLAGSKAAGLDLSEKDLSRLARLGSGSACRSIPDGWVEWIKGCSDESSFSRMIFPVDWWDLRILIVFLSDKEKQKSSTEGHRIVRTSEFFETRTGNIEKKMIEIKKSIKKRDFKSFGEIMEEEALSMHSVMMTSKPSLVYWLPETVRVIKKVQDWREEGLESYFTINTGQNVFVICRFKDEKRLIKKLKKVEGVGKVIKEEVGKGTKEIIS